METVGVRDLKARLSLHLKRVRAGHRLVVTDRGKPVATVQPVDAAPDIAWILEMVAEGKATWGGGKPRGASKPTKIRPGKLASDIVIEDRG